MGRIINFTLSLCFVLMFTCQSKAQICGSGYERSDRAEILKLYPQVEYLLNEMAQIAETTANSSSLSSNDIKKFDKQYQNIKKRLRNFGQRKRFFLYELSNLFVAEIISPEYLGISQTTVNGDTNVISQANSRNALDAINYALYLSGNCFRTSWIPFPISGSANDGQCAGGFDSRDKRVVKNKINQLYRLLTDMAFLAENGANNYLPTSTRIRNNADYQFLKEEVEIAGRNYKSPVRSQTRNFIHTFVDPIFLGINDTLIGRGLNGGTEEDALENSRNALDALNNAFYQIAVCTAGLQN
jgi:hypothetical protein